MADDLFLKLCYFGMGIVSLLLGGVAYIFLRRSLSRVTVGLTTSSFAHLLKRFFLFAMLMSSFSGFLSVSMRDCDARRDYSNIVGDRPYILSKAKSQASQCMSYLAAGLLVFGLVTTLLLASSPDAGRSPGTHAD